MLPVRFARATNPLRAIDEMFDNFDRWATHNGGPKAALFRADVREDDGGFVIEAELPGMSKDGIDITVENNVLTITAEHKSENEETQENYHVRERYVGKLERSFRLPQTADGEKVTAELKDGLLRLRVPTREEAKPRKVAVQ